MRIERPLPGEPLSLDLLNTTWIVRGTPFDLLENLDGARAWLTGNKIVQPTSEQARQALLVAREAIRAHAANPASASARKQLNEVLNWGSSRPHLSAQGPATAIELTARFRRGAWLAAVDYVNLLTSDAGRIRHCAHPDCVLYFYDTSPKRSRRWCSMAGCGNRAKATRHYARTKS